MKRLSEMIKNSSMVAVVFAAEESFNLKPEGGLAGALSNLTLPKIVSGALQLALTFAAIIFFFILVWGGIQWIVSGGDKAATEASRGRITAALVGLVIVFAAWAIAALIGTFFGVDIFNLKIVNIQTL